jgi:Transglycosylase SLT domain
MKYRVIVFGLSMVLLGAGVCTAQDAETLKRAVVYEPLMIAAGKHYGVDPRLIWTVGYLETRFRHYDDRGRIITSRAGAKGMMQFMPMTARRFGLDDPHKPADSIDAAARYLRQLQSLFNHRLDLVLAAYNAGQHAVMAFRDGRRLILSNGKILNPNGIRTGGVPPYRETYAYVKNGVAQYLRLIGATGETQVVRHKRLVIPQRVRLERTEPLPNEIAELKQGSIYIVTSDTPHKSTEHSAGSIYANR